MKLVVVSHKPCWRSPSSPSGVVTDGGFPLQMEALSQLFDSTDIVVPVHDEPPPAGKLPIKGPGVRVVELQQPRGRAWSRKLALLPWMVSNLPRIRRQVKDADAVHTPLAGDVGTFGMVFALLHKKPLFVRYCGNWGQPITLANRLLMPLLERIAGGRNVVLATGGGPQPPSPRYPDVRWIFASSLSNQELTAIGRQPLRPWSGERLRLVQVSRQEPAKNTRNIIEALPAVLAEHAETSLDIIGEGSAVPMLRRLTADLGLEGRVHFHGQLNHEQVIEVLLASDLFVFPTLSEGFPKAVLEALACGLPVITSPVSVLPHLIGDRSGVLIEDVRPATIASAILELAGDLERFAQMQAEARKTACGYSLERWRDTIGDILRPAWGALKAGEQTVSSEASGASSGHS
jgi:hypothetical protein